MEKIKSPLTATDFLKIEEFYLENKNALGLAKDISNLDSFIQKNKIFKNILGELSKFDETKAWMHLYKLVKGDISVQQKNKVSDVAFKKEYVMWTVGFIVGAILIMFTVYQFNTESKSKEPSQKELIMHRELVAQTSVKQLLRDPDSAQFRNMNGLCGEVNSKNGFGAYMGYTRFIGANELVIIEGETPGVDRAVFNETWNKFCNSQ